MIALFDNFALAILPANLSLVVAELMILAVVTALSFNLIEPSAAFSTKSLELSLRFRKANCVVVPQN